MPVFFSGRLAEPFYLLTTAFSFFKSHVIISSAVPAVEEGLLQPELALPQQLHRQ